MHLQQPQAGPLTSSHSFDAANLSPWELVQKVETMQAQPGPRRQEILTWQAQNPRYMLIKRGCEAVEKLQEECRSKGRRMVDAATAGPLGFWSPEQRTELFDTMCKSSPSDKAMIISRVIGPQSVYLEPSAQAQLVEHTIGIADARDRARALGGMFKGIAHYPHELKTKLVEAFCALRGEASYPYDYDNDHRGEGLKASVVSCIAPVLPDLPPLLQIRVVVAINLIEDEVARGKAVSNLYPGVATLGQDLLDPDKVAEIKRKNPDIDATELAKVLFDTLLEATRSQYRPQSMPTLMACFRRFNPNVRADIVQILSNLTRGSSDACHAYKAAALVFEDMTRRERDTVFHAAKANFSGGAAGAECGKFVGAMWPAAPHLQAHQVQDMRDATALLDDAQKSDAIHGVGKGLSPAQYKELVDTALEFKDEGHQCWAISGLLDNYPHAEQGPEQHAKLVDKLMELLEVHKAKVGIPQNSLCRPEPQLVRSDKIMRQAMTTLAKCSPAMNKDQFAKLVGSMAAEPVFDENLRATALSIMASAVLPCADPTQSASLFDALHEVCDDIGMALDFDQKVYALNAMLEGIKL
jgi:hypothetical protein